MKQKTWIGLAVFLTCLAVIGLYTKYLFDTDQWHIVLWVDRFDSVELENGTHRLADNGMASAKYAIYAVDGYGYVSIDGHEYDLDILDTEDAADIPRWLPSIVHDVALYGNSPKVEIDADAEIIVDGDEYFAISFLRAE